MQPGFERAQMCYYLRAQMCPDTLACLLARSHTHTHRHFGSSGCTRCGWPELHWSLLAKRSAGWKRLLLVAGGWRTSERES